MEGGESPRERRGAIHGFSGGTAGTTDAYTRPTLAQESDTLLVWPSTRTALRWTAQKYTGLCANSRIRDGIRNGRFRRENGACQTREVHVLTVFL